LRQKTSTYCDNRFIWRFGQLGLQKITWFNKLKCHHQLQVKILYSSILLKQSLIFVLKNKNIICYFIYIYTVGIRWRRTNERVCGGTIRHVDHVDVNNLLSNSKVIIFFRPKKIEFSGPGCVSIPNYYFSAKNNNRLWK